MSEPDLYLIVYCSVFGAFLLALVVYFVCDMVKNLYEARKAAPLYRAVINLQHDVEQLRNEVRQYKAALNTHTYDTNNDENTKDGN